jgi:hypothetical protein
MSEKLALAICAQRVCENWLMTCPNALKQPGAI